MSYGDSFADVYEEISHKAMDAFNVAVLRADWSHTSFEQSQLTPAQLDTLRAQRNQAIRKVQSLLGDAVKILDKVNPADDPKPGANRG